MDIATTRHPYRKAFTCGAVALIVLTVAFTAVYRRFSAEGFGTLLGLTMIPAALTGFAATRSKRAWGIARIILLYFVLLVVSLVLQRGAGDAASVASALERPLH